MRIAMHSHWFYPSVGGVETVSQILAEQFTNSGAEVTIFTHTEGPTLSLPFEVIRRPTFSTMAGVSSRADILLQNTVSLRALFPMALSGKPIVVVHQSWLSDNDGKINLPNRLKRIAIRQCENVSISQSIADALPVPSSVFGNPFESGEFLPHRGSPKERDIVFMGRLIPEKGCDLLLRALSKLGKFGLRPNLSIVGDGPEKSALQNLSLDLGIAAQVDFLGILREGRGKVIAKHRIMAIPSRWAEPFGLVALEGIAAGCAIVASSQGGLKDAAGPCATYFSNGHVDELTVRLHSLLKDEKLRERLVANGLDHIEQYKPHKVAAKYLALFQSLL